MDKTYTILIVEDDIATATGLQSLLELNGYQTIIAPDGPTAIKILDSQDVKLALLDINIPEFNGFEVLEYIRQHNSEMQIIMLSARMNPADKIRALDAGADDYVTKPFDSGELLSRIRRSLRIPSNNVLQLKDIILDYKNLKLSTESYSIDITQREAMILRLLMKNYGNIVSREDLMNSIDMRGTLSTSRNVDVHISKLRKELESIHSELSIYTKRQVGYTIK